jgi:hypothetical protein
MPTSTSLQKVTTASTYETKGETLHTDIELQLGRLHVNLGRLAAGEVTYQDLALLTRLNNILTIRLNGSAPQPTTPQEGETDALPAEPTPVELGDEDAPEPHPEETSEQFHDRRLRELILDEARLKGLTPDQEVTMNVGYIVKSVFGREVEQDVFHSYFQWLQQHQLFIGRQNSVFEFTIPKPPEAPVFVPSLDDFLTGYSRANSIERTCMIPLHINQIGEQLFGHRPSKAELNAMISVIEADPRFIKQRRTMYLVALEPIVDEPSLDLPIPTNHIKPIPLDMAESVGELPAPTREILLALFDDCVELDRRLAEIFIGSGPQRLEAIRKQIPELADQNEYEDLKKHYSNHRELLQSIIEEAGYTCEWRQNNLTTRGRTYTLYIHGFDEAVAPVPAPIDEPIDAASVPEPIIPAIEPAEPEPEPVSATSPTALKPNPLNIPVGGILEARREARRLSPNEQKVQDFIGAVVDWGLEKSNNQRIGIATTRLAGKLNTSIPEAREILDNLQKAGYVHYRKEQGVNVVEFRRVPRRTKR